MPLIPPSPSHSPTLIDRHQAMPTTMMDHKADEKRREFADTDSDEHLEIDERGVRSRHPSEPPHFLLTEPISFDLQEDYQNNVNARLQNPLYGLSREGLSKKVALFTQQSGLVEERELFEKAAILAQHPELFEEHELLDEDDKYHLRRETTHKWKQPFALCESPRHPSYDQNLCCRLISFSSSHIVSSQISRSLSARFRLPSRVGIRPVRTVLIWASRRHLASTSAAQSGTTLLVPPSCRLTPLLFFVRSSFSATSDPNHEYHEWLVGIINAAPYRA